MASLKLKTTHTKFFVTSDQNSLRVSSLILNSVEIGNLKLKY